MLTLNLIIAANVAGWFVMLVPAATRWRKRDGIEPRLRRTPTLLLTDARGGR